MSDLSSVLHVKICDSKSLSTPQPHVEPMGEKIFIVYMYFGDTPKAHFWRDQNVTLTRPRYSSVSLLSYESSPVSTGSAGRVDIVSIK